MVGHIVSLSHRRRYPSLALAALVPGLAKAEVAAVAVAASWVGNIIGQAGHCLQLAVEAKGQPVVVVVDLWGPLLEPHYRTSRGDRRSRNPSSGGWRLASLELGLAAWLVVTRRHRYYQTDYPVLHQL